MGIGSFRKKCGWIDLRMKLEHLNSMLLFQHCIACSGKDSWSPHGEISAQLQQKVWSPRNKSRKLRNPHEIK